MKIRKLKIKEAYRLAVSQENENNEQRAVMYDECGAFWCNMSCVESFIENYDAVLVCIIPQRGGIKMESNDINRRIESCFERYLRASKERFKGYHKPGIPQLKPEDLRQCAAILELFAQEIENKEKK